MAKESNIQIYAIGFGSAGVLTDLATLTGVRAFSPNLSYELNIEPQKLGPDFEILHSLFDILRFNKLFHQLRSGPFKGRQP